MLTLVLLEPSWCPDAHSQPCTACNQDVKCKSAILSHSKPSQFHQQLLLLQAGLSQALNAVFEDTQGSSSTSLTRQLEKIRRAEQVQSSLQALLWLSIALLHDGSSNVCGMVSVLV